MNFEADYAKLVQDVLTNGIRRIGRNGAVTSVFARTLTLDYDAISQIPLLHGRKMYVKGVLGEFAAFIRGPKSLADFERFGCNYWRKWAKPDRTIELDYGTSWIDYNGINQIEQVVKSLKEDPRGRRHIIDGWRPDRLSKLDLPSCHFLYQWYVRDDGYLDMIWFQRSVDVMIGLPSDIILAHVFNVCMAKETGYSPGTITMMLGDCHIYDEHLAGTQQYLEQLSLLDSNSTRVAFYDSRTMSSNPLTGTDKNKFVPMDMQVFGYHPQPAIAMEVKA